MEKLRRHPNPWSHCIVSGLFATTVLIGCDGSPDITGRPTPAITPNGPVHDIDTEAEMRARAIAFLYEASIEFEKTCPRIVWKWRRRGLLDLADVRSQLSDARDGLAPSDKVEEMIHTLIEAQLRELPWDATILTEEDHRRYALTMFAPNCRTLRGVVPGA